jgi:chaperonin GroES
MVRPEEVAERTGSGLFLPQSVREKEQNAITRGTLIEKGPNVGHGVEKIPDGATILYAKYAGTQVEVDGMKYRIINDEDVHAMVHEDAPGADIPPESEAMNG